MISYADIGDSELEKQWITKRTILNFANLIKSTMGIGICGLSRIYVNTGIPLGVTILALMGLLSFWAQRIVLKYKEIHNMRSLEEVAERALGSSGKWIIRIALAVNIYCSMICLFTFAGEFTFPLLRIVCPTAATHTSVFYKLLVSCTSITIFPLTLFKTLECLGFSSSLGMICLVILIASTILTAIFEGSVMQSPKWSPSSDMLSIVTCFGISLMANHGQHAICDIHTDSKEKSSLSKASAASCAVVALMNILLSLLVYFTFGEQQTADPDKLFVNFERSDIRACWTLAVGTLVYCLTIVVTLPLYNFYFRRMVWDSVQDLQSKDAGEEMPSWFRIACSVFAWLSATLLSVFAPNAMKVLDFAGLFSCTITMILLPASLVISDHWRRESKLELKHIVYGLMILVGIYFVGHSIRDLILTITELQTPK